MPARAMKSVSHKALHVDYSGKGRPLVLLHGWGMHGGVFKTLAAQLARHHYVAAVDLPGHGESDSYAQFADLSQHGSYLVGQLHQLFADKVTLIGWSLGGLLAQSIAMQYPQYVENLVLICSTPCFMQRDDWSCAMDAQALHGFAAELCRDYPATLSRFLSLQFLGAQHQKETLRRARELVFTRPPPRTDMLQQGLRLLESADLRADLAAIECPTLIINGERDTLVPPAAGQYLAQTLGRGRLVILKGAGHAPFLSQPDTFMYFLDRFLHEH
jgi:pimeloyl-[acyl-carrier protein] methyl ester esterase